MERSVTFHQGSAAFLSSDGDVAGQWVENDQVEMAVMLLRGASCAVELFPKQWIVGTRLGEILAYANETTAVHLCKVRRYFTAISDKAFSRLMTLTLSAW